MSMTARVSAPPRRRDRSVTSFLRASLSLATAACWRSSIRSASAARTSSVSLAAWYAAMSSPRVLNSMTISRSAAAAPPSAHTVRWAKCRFFFSLAVSTSSRKLVGESSVSARPMATAKSVGRSPSTSWSPGSSPLRSSSCTGSKISTGTLMLALKYSATPFIDAAPPLSSSRSMFKSVTLVCARQIMTEDWIMETSWPAGPCIALASFSVVESG
jgi:hypothetical protein